MAKKTIEELYQKKTPIEHILLRPETYIGPVDQHQQPMYVLEGGKIVNKEISYVPGLYKIFDEILVNAADNKIRDPSMSKIVVEISPEKISIWNNGKGVPIKIHKKENVYVPELIFGQLLTSSNYDDKEKKVTGGRNGYGAKLCNIFSKEFIIETGDSSENLVYYQRYSKNMSVREDPIIKNERVRESFTKITFKPDLKRFGMQSLDEETISLLKKRVYDMGATVKKVKVYLNGDEIPINSFKDYIALHDLPNGTDCAYVNSGRWEFAVLASDEQFQQVSFVNSICTIKGGTHVTHILDTLVGPILEKLSRKEKSLTIKNHFIKNSIFLFINCLIVNPTFDSQTKETLTLRAASFGSKCDPVKPKILDEILKIVGDKIISQAKQKQTNQLKKTDGSKKSKVQMKKLEDANKAGSKDSRKCSLFLTEGDSAKSFAITGIESIVNGRDFFGAFPLKGKLVNVRDASHDKISKNEEINNLKKIVGLQHGKVYESVDSLRYGSVIIMTDQDHDGSHIKGLIINFFEHYFPSLLKIDGFLKEFITPIIKATKKQRARRAAGETVSSSVTELSAIQSEILAPDDGYPVGHVLEFYTIPEYDTWRESVQDGIKRWEVKYFKGVGTNKSEDAKLYFSNLGKHLKRFSTLVDSDKTHIELAFSKTKADERKLWLHGCGPDIFLDHSNPVIEISDFINRELILFSMADNIRSIPSVVDGFKPGQRKVMFICLKNNITTSQKVVQLTGRVLEKAAYHHGEVSLQQTIIKLAQNFVGSNNINLLYPDGQFGSRRKGGRDAASARYISTRLAKITRFIFKEIDEELLEYIEDENVVAEPTYYVPIVPMVLINGADGIGTGWLTKIHNYNILDIIENIELLMNDKEVKKMTPWYRGFKGEIEEVSRNKFNIAGVYSVDEDELEITEIPIRVWTESYKEFLIEKSKNNAIKDFTEHHYNESIHFKVELMKEEKDIGKMFNLEQQSLCNNFVCFDRNRKIRRYENAEEILKDFYSIRLEFYNLRKQFLIKALEHKIEILDNKKRFIQEFIDGDLIISKRRKVDICNDLEMRGYLKLDASFSYMLEMAIISLTAEKILSLQRERDRLQAELDDLIPKTPKDLWRIDLYILKEEYSNFLETFENDGPSDSSKSTKKKRRKPVQKKTDSSTKPAAKPKSTKSKSTEESSISNKKNTKPKAASKKSATTKKNTKESKIISNVMDKSDSSSDIVERTFRDESEKDDGAWKKYE